MSQIYKIYCENKDTDTLIELLRDGMEVEYSSSSKNGLILLAVIPKKKRGRKKQIYLSISEIKKEYDFGTSISEIAIKAGCTERYIWKLLKKERDKQNAKE